MDYVNLLGAQILINRFIDITHNKYYGYDERYPDEANYRAISGIIFDREFLLIIVWSKFRLIFSISENLVTQWEHLEGPPKKKYFSFPPKKFLTRNN